MSTINLLIAIMTTSMLGLFLFFAVDALRHREWWAAVFFGGIMLPALLVFVLLYGGWA